MNIDAHDAGVLLHMALRYAMGRCTGVSLEIDKYAKALWPDLPEGTKNLIKRDLREEVERHGRWETENWPIRKTEIGPLGMLSDYNHWRSILYWMERS